MRHENADKGLSFSVQLTTINDAFAGDDNIQFEVARILREIANDIDNGERAGIIHDINENRVGKFRYW